MMGHKSEVICISLYKEENWFVRYFNYLYNNLINNYYFLSETGRLDFTSGIFRVFIKKIISDKKILSIYLQTR
jgi:hypothetical protein